MQGLVILELRMMRKRFFQNDNVIAAEQQVYYLKNALDFDVNPI
jgi:hypothetical protein